MESEVESPAADAPGHRATPEPAATDGRPDSPPGSDAERRKLISDALQQEDEFLEYLMSLPAAKEGQQLETTAAGKPIFARSASTHSACSSAAVPTVGLDHLDNLCKLMEQLGELREQNSKLQRRVQYLEDMKNLQEMHRQLQGETRRLQTAVRRRACGRDDGGNLTDSCLLDGSDDSLPRGRFSGGEGTSRRRQPEGGQAQQQQRGRSHSVGVEEEDEDAGDKQRGGRAKRRDKSHQRRSLAATGEVKAKVSKWTKVKEAFRWEKAAASVLPEAKSADSGLGGVAEAVRYLRVPPPGAGDHSSAGDSALSGPSSSACSSAGGQSPGLRLGDFVLPPLDTLSSSSSSEDLDLSFSDILREIGPQRSASVADSRPAARDARRHSLSRLAEEDDASRRSKSLDGDAAALLPAGKEGAGKAPPGGKAHKTPWGKVKDIIQTRKDSLRKRHHAGGGSKDRDDDACTSADIDPPPSPGDNPQDSVRQKRQSVAELPGGGRRQQGKISTCSLGSHPLALEPPPASRRLTPTLTITLPSTEELRSAPAAASLPDASPQPEERGHHKASTCSAPGAVEDASSVSVATSSSGSESNRCQAAGGRAAPGGGGGASSPPSQRAASKWTKVKKAFLTSAPGKKEDSLAPASPNRHSSFSYDFDGDELSSGDFTEAVAESGDAAPSPPPRQALQAEVRRNYEQLQQKLSLEFHRKMSEWERIKSAAASASSPGCPAVDDDGGGAAGQHHSSDKSFRRKLEEWERLRGRGKDDGRVLLHEDNLSADFRKKLHEWQRIKDAGLPKRQQQQAAAGWDSGAEDTSSPGVSRKNSGSGGGGAAGKAKRGGAGRAKSPDKAAARKKDLQWLEKELHKIDREKQRLEREREKFLEREARLEKMRSAMGSRPSRQQEVLIRTSTGFFRFPGISEKFTRRLYEWEQARGIGPEASTFALLEPGYSARLPGHRGGGAEAADGGPLSRSKSASSVGNTAAGGGGGGGGGMSHQPSSLSLNDVGALEQAEPAALEDARASSEPPPGTAGEADQGADGPRAVIVDVEDVEEETAAPLLVARGAQGHTPVYCYAPDEVTRLIDSSGSESDKDSARAVRRAGSARAESSFKLLQENMDLLGQLKISEDACRQIESKMGNIEAKIDHVTKTHEEEIERLKREEEDMLSQEASTDDRLGQLRDRILDLEIMQQRLLKEGATLQESFAEQSEQQAVIAHSLVDNARLLRACSSAEADRHAVQDLASGLLALAEQLEASLARRSRDSRSLRPGRDGKLRPSAPRFRTGHQRYSEEGMSLSTGSLHSEDGESGSLVPRQTSEDVAHLPAQLAIKVLELKQALNQMCAQSEASTKDQTGEDNAAAKPSEEASTATFVVKVGKKRSVPQSAVHVDSDGNMSPVSVTITPAFWKRKPKEASAPEDAGAERNDATSSTARSDSSPDPTTGCADTAGTDHPDVATKTSRAKSDGTDDTLSECRSSGNSNRNLEVENNGTVGETSAAALENQNKNETGAFSKESSNRLSRQKKLLKTRRVSDIRVGCDGQSEGKAKIRRQKECDERCERDSLDGSARRKDDERQPEPRTSLQDVTRITPELTFEEYNFSRHGWPSSSEGPIVNSRTTFLVNDSRGKTTSSSPVNVFVPTTRKIFSPIRRDSKGKTSTVISYVVAESSTERPSNLSKEPESKEGDKEENKLCNGIATPAARILRENRSHSSSPCLKRKQLSKQEQTCRSKEELSERPSTDRESRPLANGVASESELNSSDSTRKTGEERLSPSKAFPPLSPGPAKRELNRSVSKETAPSIRLMIARYNQKLTEQEGAGGRSPDVSHSGSGSPVAWRSPATERRVRLQTEKYQEEVRKVLQQGGRKAEGAAEVQKSASAGVIRSPEKKEEHARHPVARDPSSKKPPTAVVQPRGILKSSSAGAIKPVSPLPTYQGHPLGPGTCEDRSVLPPPEQFKDGSPGPSSPSSPELEEPLRLRHLRLQRAKEEFLSRGPGGRSWASEGGGCRLSQISVGSESSFDEGPEAPAAEEDPLLVKSASAGMISVEPGAFRRLSAEGKEAAAGARSRFGLAGIASRFRKVKMRRAKGRDAPGKLNTVSMLCRQSLLVDLHQVPPPPSSKSCPSSPVLQRSAPASSGPPAGDEGAKATGSWLRRPAKIFKPKQQ